MHVTYVTNKTEKKNVFLHECFFELFSSKASQESDRFTLLFSPIRKPGDLWEANESSFALGGDTWRTCPGYW